MADIASLADDIRPQVPLAVPEPTFTWAILQAARMFCVESKVLRETAVYNVVANQRYYILEPVAADTEIFAVKAVQLGEFPLDPTAFEEIPQSSGDALAWIFEPPEDVWLTPTPTSDVTDGLAVRQILQPVEGATTLPDALLRKYRDKITDGALSWIYNQDGMSWYNPNRAAAVMNTFEREIIKARHDADRTFRPRGFRTKPVEW